MYPQKTFSCFFWKKTFNPTTIHIKLKYPALFIFTILFYNLAIGQNHYIDSLRQELTKAQNDTSKALLCQKMASQMQNIDPDSTVKYGKLGIEISKKSGFKKGEGLCSNELAYFYLYFGDSVKFLNYIQNALSIGDQLKNKSISTVSFNILGLYYESKSQDNLTVFYLNKALQGFIELNEPLSQAAVLNNMGMHYAVIGNYPQAIENHLKALKINEDAANDAGLLWTYMEIASLYTTEKAYNLAIDYINKSLTIGIKLNDNSMLSSNYALMGDNYFNQAKYPEALANYKKSLEYSLKTGEKFMLEMAYKRIGDVYENEKKYDSAYISYSEALKIIDDLDNPRLLSELNSSFAQLYYDNCELDKSIAYGTKAYTLASQLNYPDIIGSSSDILYKVFKKKKDAESALKYLEISKSVNDSLFTSEKRHEIENLTYTYELDKKQDKIVMLEKDNTLFRLQIVIVFTLFVIALLSFVFYLVIKRRRLKIKQLQHEAEIKNTQYQLELKHRELTQKATQIIQQEELLDNLKEKLLDIKGEKPSTNKAILDVISDVEMYARQSSWDDFEKYFNDVHPEFYRNLKLKYSELSQNELRVCALIRLNLNTKQMADITQKTGRSIDVMRSRIRQKMGLIRNENLFDVLMEVN